MLALLLLALTVSAATAANEPAAAGAAYSGRDHRIHVTVPRIEATVTIDGVLDEEVWQRAARLVDFSEYSPVDGRPADEASEVYVWYSPTAIYFGVRAHMPPGTVHATLANRDHIDADDGFDIFLSPFNDGRQALVFGVNPLGIQGDGVLVEGTGKRTGSVFSALESGREQTDLTPDYVYVSKGRLTSDGYEVEIEIPFKTLRFPSGSVQSWGINVLQRVQATGHEHSWAPASRANNSFLGQSGTLDGLQGLHRGLVLDVNPVVTAKADGAPRTNRWAYRGDKPQVGANLRWGITPNLALGGTINPDFSQVEADASQFVIDPRSALFFPEKRPFFLEGAELFAAPNDLIYTRRIVSPLGATKVTGTVAGTNLAVLSAVDGVAASAGGADHPIFNIARLQRSLGGNTKIGMVYTDRVEGSDFNRVAAADTRFTFGSIYSLQFQGGASITRTSRTTTAAPIWQAIFSRDGHRVGYRYELTGIHENFHAASGFISRSGIIHGNLTHRVSLFGDPRAFLQSWSSAVAVDGIWQYRVVNTGDPLLEKKLHFYNTAKLEGGWVAGASLLIESFAFDTQLYGGYALQQTTSAGDMYLPFTGTPHLHNRDYVLSLNTPQFSRFTGSASWVWGRDENFFEWSSGDIAFITYTLDWRPSERLRVSPEYRVQTFDRRTDGSRVGSRRVPRLKVEYQLSRSIFFRFVGQYDARQQDTLRDDSRTGLSVVIRDPATGVYVPATAFEQNLLRVDWLFSYQPRPGTVVFAGYGSSLDEPQALRFNQLRRTADGFFVKVSYLFRM